MTKITKEQLIKEYWFEKKSGIEIAKKFNVTQGYVSRLMKKFDVPARSNCGCVAWNKGLKMPKRMIRKRFSHSSETKFHLRQQSLALWKDEKYRRRTIHARASSCGKNIPNSYEEKIIELCDEASLPFVFVGNWQFTIERCCPDFISIDDSMRIIETYCRFWHHIDYEEIRTGLMNRNGFKVLFLSDDDLNRDDWKLVCFNKIKNFL